MQFFANGIRYSRFIIFLNPQDPGTITETDIVAGTDSQTLISILNVCCETLKSLN